MTPGSINEGFIQTPHVKTLIGNYVFANSQKQMVFTFPYKLAVRFSYARTPFQVHTPENVYHMDANIRMQQKFKLRRTHDQSRRQIATQNNVVSPHLGKFLPFAHQQRNAMEIQTSAHSYTNFSFTLFPASQPLPRDELTFAFVSVMLQPLIYSTASQWSST
jgi:hypothetical protein